MCNAANGRIVFNFKWDTKNLFIITIYNTIIDSVSFYHLCLYAKWTVYAV